MSERRKDGIHFNHLCVDRRGAIKLGVGGAVLAAVGHNGVLHKDLPVVWVAKRYQRAVAKNDGSFQTAIDVPTAGLLIRYGYVIVPVDRKGTAPPSARPRNSAIPWMHRMATPLRNGWPSSPGAPAISGCLASPTRVKFRFASPAPLQLHRRAG